MTVKSIVSNTPCNEKELTFPRLMKGIRTKSIVLFKDKLNGTIIVQGNRASGSGKVGITFQSNPCDYVDFKGSVCLENDKD